MDYTTEFSNYLYLEAKMQQQQSLESYINECVAIAESANVYNTLRAINEDENQSAGEKIKSSFTKFINWIKSIFQKFSDWVYRLFKGNKGWLDKNRDLILHNECKLDVTLNNYEEGIKRIVDGLVPAFDYNNLNSKGILDSDESCYKEVYKDIKAGNDYKFVDTATFSTDVTNFFCGGENTIEYGPSKAKKLNMTDIFNFCYEYDKMVDRVNKDKTNIENMCTKMQNILQTNAAKTEPTQQNTQAANTSTDAASNAEKSEEKEAEVSVTPQQDNKNESYAFSKVYNTYITEDDNSGTSTQEKKIATSNTPTINASGSDNQSGTTKKTTGVAGDANATAGKQIADGSVGALNGSQGKSYGDMNDSNKKAATDATDSKAITEMQEKCTRYRSAVTTVLTVKMTVIKKIYTDYMKILIAHVKSYKDGTKAENNKVADTATNYSVNIVKIGKGEKVEVSENASAEEQKSAEELQKTVDEVSAKLGDNADQLKVANEYYEKIQAEYNKNMSEATAKIEALRDQNGELSAENKQLKEILDNVRKETEQRISKMEATNAKQQETIAWLFDMKAGGPFDVLVNYFRGQIITKAIHKKEQQEAKEKKTQDTINKLEAINKEKEASNQGNQ